MSNMMNYAIIAALILLVAIIAAWMLGARRSKSARRARKAEDIRAEDVVDLASALKKVFKAVQEPTPEVDEQYPAAALYDAERVVIVPGQGLVVSRAQLLAKQLACLLAERGAEVVFALHPEAGHIPGRIRSLLSGADIQREQIIEDMERAHAYLKRADACIVIGANDVINPVANIAQEGSPLFGKTVLDVERAKHLILCNLDAMPGLSGAENLLYARTIGITLLFGDAKDSLKQLIDGLSTNYTLRMPDAME